MNETSYGFLFVFSLLPILASFIAYFKGRNQLALWLLIFGGLCLRLTLISFDQYLHQWDERFHALVAKNMMSNPFKPMLISDPVLEYNYKHWWNNHIWVHKQPLFLWQIAISLKIFGISEFAVRIPSALMGTALIYFVYHIAMYWSKNEKVAYLAALLSALSFFQLGLTVGNINLDHNDLSFLFYITVSIWAWTKYLQKINLQWSITVGFFIGCAILIKWLTACVIFGGWGLYILLNQSHRKSFISYLHILFAIATAALIVVPWQIYIMHEFPLEAAYSYELNRLHITKALDGHSGSNWYHLRIFRTNYRYYLGGFMLLGITISLFKRTRPIRSLSIVFLSMIVVVYGFFSIIVATKMPAFTFMISSLVYLYMALGIIVLLERFLNQISISGVVKRFCEVVFFVVISFSILRPVEIIDFRTNPDKTTLQQIEHTEIFKSIDQKWIDEYIIFNCLPFEQFELMFYRGGIAYAGFPTKQELQTLKKKGYKIAWFPPWDNEKIPDYMEGKIIKY